jgi:hypothetical protein
VRVGCPSEEQVRQSGVPEYSRNAIACMGEEESAAGAVQFIAQPDQRSDAGRVDKTYVGE